MPISKERITADINAIAQFTQTPGAGATRPTFSASWKSARDYIASQAESIGCHLRIDAAGNLRARPGAITWEAPVWLSGSHLDSVRNGGNYDGVVGVVAALEVLRAAREDLKVACPMELVVWAGSEDSSFGQTLIGSRAFIGEVSADDLANLKNPEGLSYSDAGAAQGVVPEKLASDALRLGMFLGCIEVHVEESPDMWERDIHVACGSAMTGRRQYRCQFDAQAGPGDPLLAAAEAILSIEKLGQDPRMGVSIFSSQLDCQPNIVGIRTKQVSLGLDMRSAEMTNLAVADQSIRKSIEKIAQTRALSHKVDVLWSQSAVAMDERICNKLSKSADVCGADPFPNISIVSPHDAMILAPKLPSAMLMVASRDGIAHAPDEFARPEDIALAASILLETVRDRRLE